MKTYQVVKTYRYTEEIIVEAETKAEAEQIAMDSDDCERIHDDTLLDVVAKEIL